MNRITFFSAFNNRFNQGHSFIAYNLKSSKKYQNW